MVACIHRALIKLVSCITTLAILTATFNVNTTCLFMSYQPDIPEELL